MILVDRKTTALLIVAVFCLLPTAAAGPPADKPGTGASTGALERLETFTAEQKAHRAYQPLKRPELPDVRKLSWVRNLDDGAIEPAVGAAWADLALALLNCNEFLYVP